MNASHTINYNITLTSTECVPPSVLYEELDFSYSHAYIKPRWYGIYIRITVCLNWRIMFGFCLQYRIGFVDCIFADTTISEQDLKEDVGKCVGQIKRGSMRKGPICIFIQYHSRSHSPLARFISCLRLKKRTQENPQNYFLAYRYCCNGKWYCHLDHLWFDKRGLICRVV